MFEVIRFLKFLYHTIGIKMFVWLFLALCTAFLEGMGVSLLLPIVEGENADSKVAKYAKIVFNFLQLEYSFAMLLVVVVIFFCLRASFFVIQDAFIKWVVSRLFIEFRVKGITHFFQADYQYALKKGTGYINNAITAEYPRVIGAFEQCLNLVVSIGFACVYFVLPFWFEPKIVIALSLFGLPMYFLLRLANKFTREYSILGTDANAQFQKFLIQALHQFKYLKTTHGYHGILKKISETCDRLGTIFFKQSLVQSITSSATEPLSFIFIAGLVFYQVEVKGEDLLEVVFLLFLLRRAITYCLAVQQNYRKFLGLSGSVRVYEELEAELSENDENQVRQGGVPNFAHPIQFKNVSFAYGDGQMVLEKINFTIPPNKTVAFVGASGSGKSTIVTLLTGVLQPTGGQILMGDQDYTMLDQTLLRRNVGYVTQESVVFNDTILNNITMWDSVKSISSVECAASKAHIRDFIERLPAQYNEILGDNGINISGGQRQRISIARELYKDAQLIIFDEATSALDSQSEVEVQKSIDEFKGEKTVVLIAHRLSTVKNSDVIFVLNKGRIVEQGTYTELCMVEGEFKKMVDQQTVTIS